MLFFNAPCFLDIIFPKSYLNTSNVILQSAISFGVKYGILEFKYI